MSETTILCIGDLHFSPQNTVYTDDLHRKLEKAMIFLSNKSITIDFIVLLGDILHLHEHLKTPFYNRSLNFIKMLMNYTNKVFILIGNHDYINNSQFLTDQHPFNALKEWNKVVIVDHVIEEGDFLFCPYVANGRFIEALNTIGEEKWKTKKIIFSHVAINGARFGPMTVMDSDDWLESYPLLITGHIHESQKLFRGISDHSKGFSRGKVVYVGASYQITDGEKPPAGPLLIKEGNNTFSGSRILLKLKKRGILRDDLKNFSGSDGYTKLILSVETEEERSTFKKSEQYRKCIESGISISLPLKHVAVNQSSIEKKTFMEILNESLTSEEKILVAEIEHIVSNL